MTSSPSWTKCWLLVLCYLNTDMEIRSHWSVFVCLAFPCYLLRDSHSNFLGIDPQHSFP